MIRLYSNSWSDGTEIVKKPSVYIHQAVLGKFKGFADRLPNLECGAFLIGENETIHDIVVGKQEVTKATVDFQERPQVDNIIGTIHSHNSMSAFLSGTDDEFLALQHKYTLVYSFVDGFRAWQSFEVNGGNVVIVEAQIVTVYSNDYSDFINEALSLTKEKKYTYTPKPVKYSDKGSYLTSSDKDKSLEDLKNEENNEDDVIDIYETCAYCYGPLEKTSQYGICEDCLEEEFAEYYGKHNAGKSLKALE